MIQPTARVVSDREFVLEHTFRAPAAKVFAAYTDPALIPKWWSPRGGSIRVDTLDVRPGGAWRFVQTLCSSKEQRDGMLGYGAAMGAKAAWDALAQAIGA